MGRIHMVLFLNAEVFASDGRGEMIFEQGRYAYDRPYCGFVDLPKHFFPEIGNPRSEEHTSELQSHSFISYAVFCLKKKKKNNKNNIKKKKKKI